MKQIKAIIQPFRLSKIVSALKQIPGLPGVTIHEVRGFGRQQAAGASESVIEGTDFYVKKMQLEVVVPESQVEQIIETIRAHAFTGNPGDGKIFVHSVDDVLRISTGERGERAL